MNEFDQMLARNAIMLMLFVCTMTALVVCWAASRFEGRILPTILLSLSTIPIAIAVGTATVLSLAMEFNLGAVLSTFGKGLASALAFFAETGTEFAVGFPISILVLIIFQFRRKPLTIPAPSSTGE